jgi:hypothetical protein
VPQQQVPLTDEELGELLGPVAAGWTALGLKVYRGGCFTPNGADPQQQVRVFHGPVMIGWTQEPHGQPGEREYRPVEFTDREGLVYGKAYPEGLPADPLALYREAKK